MFKAKKLNMKAIYEHRHLFTDDVHYNSLVTSMLINEPINLVSLEHFINLDTSVIKKIIHDLFIVFIQLDGLTFFFNSKHQGGGARLCKYKKTWEYLTTVYVTPNANSTMLVLTHV